MNLDVEFDEKKLKAFITRIEKGLSKSVIDKIIEAAAWKGQRLFASTLNSKSIFWLVKKLGDGQQISTANKVALFLEDGTKAHGPKTAKFLYIPLRPGAATWRKGFVFGKDYILTKRVKGIKARKYLKPVSEKIFKDMLRDFETHLKAV